MESSGNQAKGLSFGFSKTKQVKKLVASVIKDEAKDAGQETDYVTSLEDRAVKSVKPATEEAKPLVIPLIKQNKWCLPTPEDLENNDSQPAHLVSRKEKSFKQTGDEITDKAVEELVSESRRELEELQGRGQEDVNRAIPILMKNKVPEGFETDDRLDVQLRPDEAAEADYDDIPIEHFGMAMLRGMGFKEGEGLGKHKKTVAPIDAVARPKGLGLGADRSLNLQKAGDGNSSESKDEEHLVMKRGSFCVVQAGKHNGLYATVEGIDEDNARVVIKLTLGGTVVTLNQMAVKVVTRKEYDKCCKYINKVKVDKYKEDEEMRKKSKKSKYEEDEYDSGSRDRKDHKHREHPERSESDTKRHKSKHHKDDKHYKSDSKHYDSHSRKYGSDSDRYRDSMEHYDDGEKHRREMKHEKGKSHSNRDKDRRPRNSSRSPHRDINIEKKSTHREKHIKLKNSSNGSSRNSLWLHAHLRVRMIDPESKYFKSKLIIEDVVSLDSCICRSGEGRILEGISQSALETVIPKADSACVMVVAGRYKGQVGEILGRNKSLCTAVVQILPDRDEILTLDYDVICEYTGDIHDLM